MATIFRPITASPIPKRRQALLDSSSINNLALTTPVVTAVPFKATDWPLPSKRLINRDLDWMVPSLMDGGFMPFGQADWPNPQLSRRSVAVLDFVQQSRAFYVTVPPPSPFSQADWPNPRAAKRARGQDWIVSGFAVPAPPFSQTDWGLPPISRRSIAARSFDQQNTTINMPAPAAGAMFRRTLSPLGTRIGSRQAQRTE